MDMFMILIGMMISLVYIYIKMHQTVHFTVFQFYFKKAIKKLDWRERHR